MNILEFKNQFIQISTQLNNSFTSADAVKRSKEEFYSFLDTNYKTYLNANDEERNVIRNTFIELHANKQGRNMLDFFMLGYIQRAIEKIETDGEKVWLIRGLVIAAIEDGIRDHRDTIDLLAHMFVAAEEKGLKPNIEFQKISEIANHYPSLPDTIPMSQIILEMHANAYKINEGRKRFL